MFITPNEQLVENISLDLNAPDMPESADWSENDWKLTNITEKGHLREEGEKIYMKGRTSNSFVSSW